MRRKPAAHDHPNKRRAGVTASAISRNRRVQSPVRWVMNSMGLADRLPVNARQTSMPRGIRQAANTHGLTRRTDIFVLRSRTPGSAVPDS